MFSYPNQPHSRKHGPRGYLNHDGFKEWLRDEFTFRCVYCLFRERHYPNDKDAFSVDHHLAQKPHPKLALEYDNLVYACVACNSRKKAKLALDPCKEAFSSHLHVNSDGIVTGLSVEGKDLVDCLSLNRPKLVRSRQKHLLMENIVANAPSVTDLTDRERVLIECHKDTLRFPEDLPNLAALRPPKGNSRPCGVLNCFFALAATGRLPNAY